MKLSLLPLLAFALITPALADEAMKEPVTLKVYQALPESERETFLAGLADGYVAAASEVSNERSAAISSCLSSFDGKALRAQLESGEIMPQMKWSEDAPAAQWALTGMIYVCQLQLPPPAP